MRFYPVEAGPVVLRAPRLSDAAALTPILKDPLIGRHIPHMAKRWTPATTRAWLSKVRKVRHDPQAGMGVEYIVEREGTVVGAAHISWNKAEGRALVGYLVGKPFRGQGTATAVARALTEFAFSRLGAQKVFAVAFGDNLASRRALKAAGMKQEALLRSHVVVRGERRDDAYYGVLRSEWQAARRRPEHRRSP